MILICRWLQEQTHWYIDFTSMVSFYNSSCAELWSCVLLPQKQPLLWISPKMFIYLLIVTRAEFHSVLHCLDSFFFCWDVNLAFYQMDLMESPSYDWPTCDCKLWNYLDFRRGIFNILLVVGQCKNIDQNHLIWMSDFFFASPYFLDPSSNMMVIFPWVFQQLSVAFCFFVVLQIYCMPY